MKYTYLISFSCMLAGCGDALTLEQVEKAKAYCASKSATTILSTAFDPTEPRDVYCRTSDNFKYRVSMENMK